MTLPAYEYRGLKAHTWDLFRGDTSQWSDRFFYLNLIALHGQPVLDVGCGTGRLLLDYRAQGIDIDGVDNSPEMLALCRAKAARLGLAVDIYEQHMEALALPRTYRTILIPSSSLQLITEPAQADMALAQVAAHLTRGGVLAASFMTLWQPGDPLEHTIERSVARPHDGAVVTHTGWSHFDPTTACESTRDRYDVRVGGEVVATEEHERHPATRSYTQAQARALFERAGLADIQVYHEFSSEPATPDDTLFTLVGCRATHHVSSSP